MNIFYQKGISAPTDKLIATTDTTLASKNNIEITNIKFFTLIKISSAPPNTEVPMIVVILLLRDANQTVLHLLEDCDFIHVLS